MTIDEAFTRWNESGSPEVLDRGCVVDEIAFGAAAFCAGAEWAAKEICRTLHIFSPDYRDGTIARFWWRSVNVRCSGCGAAVDMADPSLRFEGTRFGHRCPGSHPQCGHFPDNGTSDDCEAPNDEG